MIIEIKLIGDIFTIHINDLLHLYICEPIISVQSFNSQNKFYNIGYKTKNQTILREYDTKEKFETILKELGKII